MSLDVSLDQKPEGAFKNYLGLVIYVERRKWLSYGILSFSALLTCTFLLHDNLTPPRVPLYFWLLPTIGAVTGILFFYKAFLSSKQMSHRETKTSEHIERFRWLQTKERPESFLVGARLVPLDRETQQRIDSIMAFTGFPDPDHLVRFSVKVLSAQITAQQEGGEIFYFFPDEDPLQATLVFREKPPAQ